MKNFLLTTILICLFSSPALALDVVASTTDLAAVAKAVGGDDVSVKVMSAPSQDPHYVDPKPSLTLMLNRADALVINGLELEVGWLPPLQTNARNPKIQTGGAGFFDASQHVKKLGATGKIDRTKGDVHPGGNPHYMHDPRAASKVATALASHFAKLDAENSSKYLARAEAFTTAAKKLTESQAKKFRALSTNKRKVVSYHDSLAYLYDWLGLEQVITVEPKPGIAPNPGHVAKVLKTMRAGKIGVIIQEAYYPTKTSKTLTRMAKADLAVIPGGANFEAGESYLERVERTTKEIYDAIAK